MRWWRTRLFGSALLAAGCGLGEHTPHPADEAPRRAPASAAREPAPTPTPAPDEAAAVVQTMEALAAVHRAHKHDCAALARQFDAFRAHHPELASAPKSAYQRIEADEALRRRMRAAMTDIMSAGMACEDSGDFQAALLVLSRNRN